MTAAAPSRCDANSTGRAATDWGEHALPCQTVRGTRSFVDRQGIVRFYCAAPGHEANAKRRFGLAAPYEIEDGIAASKFGRDLALERSR